MAKVQTKNVATKLRNKNLFYLFTFFTFSLLSWVLLPYYFAGGVLCIVGALVCLYLLITPTIHYLPATRHAVVSLDISGASKSIRFVRTNVGSFVVCIYTPKTDKTTVQTSVNSKLQKTDSGGVKLTSDVVQMDRFSYNGLYQKTVLEGLELDFAGALCMYVCVLIRSKNDAIFDTVQLKKYLDFLVPRIFVGVLIVRVLLTFAKSLYYSFLFLVQLNIAKNVQNPSPIEGGAKSNPQNPANSVVVSEKQTNVKGVQHV